MIPPKGKSTGRPQKYNFKDLEIGECMHVDKEDKKRAIQAAYQHGKVSGKKFTQRKGGLEIWRES